MIRWLVRVLIRAALLLAVLLIGLGLVLTDSAPTVAERAAPTPEEVVQARDFVRELRNSISTDNAGSSRFVTTEAELNSVITLGARIVPGFRGHLTIEPQQAVGQLSVPIPMTGQARWLNLSASIPEFTQQMEIGSVTVGGIAVPPRLALGALRTGANLYGGNDLGDKVLGAASQMEIAAVQVTFVVEMDQLGRNGIMRGMFQTLRQSELPGADEIAYYHRTIREAMEDGTLPTTGSYLPYLRFTLTAALERSAVEGAANAYTSALFGLALVCGAQDFPLLVGGLMPDELLGSGDWTTRCDDLTLNGRVDSRRHFTTAAAIQAASNRGFAVSIGEFKELNDATRAGFDFTDIAANNSGIRMSDLFMTTGPAAWPGLIARLEAEGDVIVSFDGLPQILERGDFQQTYRDIDSPAYREMLASIESRIDGLTLHR